MTLNVPVSHQPSLCVYSEGKEKVSLHFVLPLLDKFTDLRVGAPLSWWHESCWPLMNRWRTWQEKIYQQSVQTVKRYETRAENMHSMQKQTVEFRRFALVLSEVVVGWRHICTIAAERLVWAQMEKWHYDSLVRFFKSCSHLKNM